MSPRRSKSSIWLDFLRRLAGAGVALAVVKLEVHLQEEDERPRVTIELPILKVGAIQQGTRIRDEQALASATRSWQPANDTAVFVELGVDVLATVACRSAMC